MSNPNQKILDLLAKPGCLLREFAEAEWGTLTASDKTQAISIDRFLERLASSRLVGDQDLRQINKLVEERPSATVVDILKPLLSRGQLTPFQARVLLGDTGEPLVLGRYVVLNCVGEGGMGRVYKASDQRLPRIVALKVVSPQVLDSEGAKRRFVREAKVAARLMHQNIVTTLDAGCIESTYVLAMEYMEGVDLRRLVQRSGPLLVEQALDYTLQAARGLAYAHRNQVIHRDVKPSNFMVDDDDQVKLLDLGLARFSDNVDTTEFDDLTVDGQVFGTVDYLPPEQAISARHVDHRADIYALGCTLHYLLMAKPVFSGDSPSAKIGAHGEVPIPALRARRDDIPSQLDELFRHMIAKKPEDRIASMEAVVGELEAILAQSRTISPTPVKPGEGAHRSRSWWVGVGAIALLGAVALFFCLSHLASNGDPIASTPPQAARSVDPSVDLQQGSLESQVPVSPRALVVEPARVEGVKSWSIETVVPRGEKDDFWQGRPAISPDDKYVAVVTKDSVLRIYDLGTGDLVHAWLGHRGGSWDVAWSRDQKYIATVANAGTAAGEDSVHIWEHPSGRLLETIDLNPALSVEWSPVADVLAISGNGLFFWKPGSGLEQAPGTVDRYFLDWSSDGQHIAMATARSRAVQIWHVRNADLQNPLTDSSQSQSSELGHAWWSPNGKLIATCNAESVVRVWDMPSGRLLDSFKGGQLVTPCWSPDSQVLAYSHPHHHTSVGFRNVEVGNWDTKKIDLATQILRSTHLSWSRDGRSLVALVPGGGLRVFDMPEARMRFGHDEIKSFIRSWPTDRQLLLRMTSRDPHPHYESTDNDWGLPRYLCWELNLGKKWETKAADIAFDQTVVSPDGRRFATYYLQDVSVFEDGVFGSKRRMNVNIWNLAWSPDSANLAIGMAQSIEIWDPVKDIIVRGLEPPVDGPRRMLWVDANHLAVADHRGNVVVMDIDGRSPSLTLTHDANSNVDQLVRSPDGKHVAARSLRSRFISVWHIPTGDRVRRLQGFPPALQVSWQRNQIYCLSDDGAIRGWTLQDGLAPRVHTRTFLHGDLSANFDATGRFVAVGWGATKWLFEVASGKCVGAVLGIPNGHVMQVSPQGHYLASTDATNDIVYSLVTDAGQRLTLKPREFEQRYGWRNKSEEARVRLD